MIMSVILVILLGFLTGVVVNLLADYLPARRHYQIARSSPFTTVKPQVPAWLPRRSDGSVWSPVYWSGLVAALTRTTVFDPPRSLRRVVVEVGLMVAFPLIEAAHQNDQWLNAGLGFLLFYLPALVLIAVIDLEHRFVMIETILVTALVVVIEQLVNPRFEFGLMLSTGLYAFAVMLALYALGWVFGLLVRLLSGRRIGRTIFGFGDVQIAALGGLMLGLQEKLVPALFIMVFAGGIGALLFILRRKRRRGRYRPYSAIPYGPFICLGIAVTLYLPTLAAIVTIVVFGYNPF
jgi:prepilin signal peptidase PulO-like enzyme (type II secretory pathway)